MTRLIAAVIALCGWVAAPAMAADLWIFDGTCDGFVEAGPLGQNIKGTPHTKIPCDVAMLGELDNGRKLMQFGTKDGKISPLGFAGSTYEPQGNMIRLSIDRMYPRHALATTAEEIFADTMVTKTGSTEGFCFFDARDFRSAKGISCVSKVTNGSQRVVFRMDFKVTRATFRPSISLE